MIELLAVGEPLGLSVLEKITDPGGLEEAEAHGFVAVHQDGRRDARPGSRIRSTARRYGRALPRSRLRRISAVARAARSRHRRPPAR